MSHPLIEISEHGLLFLSCFEWLVLQPLTCMICGQEISFTHHIAAAAFSVGLCLQGLS